MITKLKHGHKAQHALKLTLLPLSARACPANLFPYHSNQSKLASTTHRPFSSRRDASKSPISTANSAQKRHIFHSEGTEQYIKWLTRLDILFLCGNSTLLSLEMMNPFFGYWHGVSEAMIVIFSLAGARALHHYSVRMIHNIWLLPDNKSVEVEFFGAFTMPKSEVMQIKNFGHVQESRFHNVQSVTYQNSRSLFIHTERNMFDDDTNKQLLD